MRYLDRFVTIINTATTTKINSASITKTTRPEKPATRKKELAAFADLEALETINTVKTYNSGTTKTNTNTVTPTFVHLSLSRFNAFNVSMVTFSFSLMIILYKKSPEWAIFYKTIS